MCLVNVTSAGSMPKSATSYRWTAGCGSLPATDCAATVAGSSITTETVRVATYANSLVRISHSLDERPNANGCQDGTARKSVHYASDPTPTSTKEHPTWRPDVKLPRSRRRSRPGARNARLAVTEWGSRGPRVVTAGGRGRSPRLITN